MLDKNISQTDSTISKVIARAMQLCLLESQLRAKALSQQVWTEIGGDVWRSDFYKDRHANQPCGLSTSLLNL